MEKHEILLVDDDPMILKTLGSDLEIEGYSVITAQSGEEALAVMGEKNFDLVMTDLVMNKSDGISVLKKAKELDPDTMVIIITGYGDLTSAIDALRLDADDYLLKPCDPDEIHFRVRRCIEKLELKRKVRIYENILPVCCDCKKVRDDTGKEPGTGCWLSLENYISDKTKTKVTSTYCPDCAKKLRKTLTHLRKAQTPPLEAPHKHKWPGEIKG